MSWVDVMRISAELAGAGRRNRWDRARLQAWQQRRLDALLAHARRRSAYYADALKGLEGAPLAMLPVLDKATLNGAWDRIATDPALTRADAAAFVQSGPPLSARLNGRYRAMQTGGTTGVPAVFAYTDAEWSSAAASMIRTAHWTMRARPRRMAMVSLDASAHMSAHMAATFADVFPTLRVDARLPVADQVARLNAYQPDALSGYASALTALADEQLAGRLAIRPASVTTGSETLTPAARRHIARAFTVTPHDSYATTEGACGASVCGFHEGLHLLEDYAIFEVVDAQNRPVPDGEVGDKVLVTVLWSRTLPLIRYELPDRFRIAAEPCRCGLPFRRTLAIDGRSGDVLELPGRSGGAVRIAPHQFDRILGALGVTRWQIVDHGGGALTVRVAGAAPDADGARRIAASLADHGAAARIAIETRDALPVSATGKLARFVREPAPRADACAA